MARVRAHPLQRKEKNRMLGGENKTSMRRRALRGECEPDSVRFAHRAQCEARVSTPKERKNSIREGFSLSRVFAVGEDSHGLSLTSELDALCAANADRILRALRTEPSAKRGYRLQRKEKTASARDAVFSLEATPGFGPGVEVLQTFALPLGYVAVFPLCSHIIADEFCFVKPFSAFVNFFVFLARGALCALLINSLCTCRDVDTMAVLCYIEHRKAVVR